MLFIRRHLEISSCADNRDIIVKKLEELGCLAPDIKYYQSKILGSEVIKVHIKVTMNADKLDDLIKWLQTEIKGIVSITF